MNAADFIRELTLPVVLISANGLICLALYNRLAAVTGRLRAFCRERFEMQLHLAEVAVDRRAAGRGSICERLTVLDRQRTAILRRAFQLRNALILLLLSVVGFLTTSLLMGLAAQFAVIGSAPMLTFVFGTLAMIGGVGLAIGELLSALDSVAAEDSGEPLLDEEFALLPPEESEPRVRRLAKRTVHPPHVDQPR